MGRIAKKYNLCSFGKKYETVNRALLFILNQIKHEQCRSYALC